MPTSTVKWFDAKKGYGFIEHPQDGDDIFVHYSNIESDDDFKTLESGEPVEFELNDGPKGLHALDVAALEEDRTSSAAESESSQPNDESTLGPADVDPTAKVTPTFSADGESTDPSG